jgi:hypothetical protein
MANEAARPFVWGAVADGSEGPGPRSRHVLAHHRDDGATVLFGGILWEEDGRLLSDTWELRDRRWSRVDARTHPPPRHRGAMVYDGCRGCCLLFGGQGHGRGGFPMLGDTWTYAAGRWRRWRSWLGARPSPRCGHALAFDEEEGVVVLFGGIAPGDRSLGDTWRFDGSWRAVPGPGPSPRRYAAFAYDPELRGCVLNGGSEDDAGRHSYGDTWLFRDGQWTRLADGFDTAAHDDHGLVYHRAAGRLVMFGGLGGPHGVLVREASGWRSVEAHALPPRFQCSPPAWDHELGGVVHHGGEVCHAGPQFDTTWVIRLARA